MITADIGIDTESNSLLNIWVNVWTVNTLCESRVKANELLFCSNNNSYVKLELNYVDIEERWRAQAFAQPLDPFVPIGLQSQRLQTSVQCELRTANNNFEKTGFATLSSPHLWGEMSQLQTTKQRVG